MTDVFVVVAWVLGGIAAVGFIFGIVSGVRGSGELSNLLSKRFGSPAKDWPDEHPLESADCTLEALDERLIGWVFVRKDGLLFRQPGLKSGGTALLFPWSDLVGFRTNPMADTASFSIERPIGAPIDVKMSLDRRLSEMAMSFHRNATAEQQQDPRG